MKHFLSLIYLFGIIIISSIISGCDYSNHIHQYELEYDVNSHFQKCKCGDIIDSALHTFKWVIDVYPTTDNIGFKHEECEICMFIINEGTVIDCIESNIIYDEIIKPQYSLNFNKLKDMEEFLINNSKYKNWVIVNDIKKSNDRLNIYNCHYDFNYDNLYDDVYENSYVSIQFSLYSETLGTDTDPDMDVMYHSVSFLFNLYEIEFIDELTFQFYKYDNSKFIYNNVVFIYSNNLKLGEVYYYEKLGISKEWISEFLKENLKQVY